MQYAHLGRSGVVVSRLCLGTMNFGAQASEQDSFAIMDKSLDAGINFFDCANVYGIPKRQGLSEEIIGNWFAQDTRAQESDRTHHQSSLSDGTWRQRAWIIGIPHPPGLR